MNHDICHCEGENCDLKDICKRYIAHKRRSEAKGRPLAYAKPQHSGKYCELFWKHNEEN